MQQFAVKVKVLAQSNMTLKELIIREAYALC